FPMWRQAQEVVLVCGSCDSSNVLGRRHCCSCGRTLVLFARCSEAGPAGPIPQPGPKRSGSHNESVESSGDSGFGAAPPEPSEVAMDQAKYYVCSSCMTPVPSGHKFCGRCGAGVPDEIL